MTALADDGVRAAVLARVAPKVRAKGLEPETLPDDFDLLAEGVIDSFGLLELIGELERSLGVELDFEDVDPDDMTLLGPFVKFVETQSSIPTSTSRAPQAPAVELEPTTSGAPITPPAELTAARSGAGRRRIGGAALSLHRFWVRARDKAFSLAASGGFHSFGSNSVIQLPARFKNPHRIAIGSGVFVGAGAWLQVLDADGGVALEIGDGASIAEGCVLSTAGSVRLGTKVSFARNVYVADHSHRYEDTTRPSLEQGITDVQPVAIGDWAWLGENVMVMPGVRIGRGAVIAANSVVSRDIPDFSVAAGAPARIVRRF